MAMSDCIKCWDTPCCCGYEYRNMTVKGRIEQASVALGINVEVLTALVLDDIPKQHPKYDGTGLYSGMGGSDSETEEICMPPEEASK